MAGQRLEAGSFTPTKWKSAEDKAMFGNSLLKFIAHDFPRNAFTKRLYQPLSNTFGHIAHYDLAGFFSTFFEDTPGKIDFLQQALQWPCWGDPECTFSDVERIVQTRLHRSGLLAIKRTELDGEIPRTERATLNRVKAKYEPSLPLAEANPPAPPAQPLRQADLFDLRAQ